MLAYNCASASPSLSFLASSSADCSSDRRLPARTCLITFASVSKLMALSRILAFVARIATAAICGCVISNIRFLVPSSDFLAAIAFTMFTLLATRSSRALALQLLRLKDNFASLLSSLINEQTVLSLNFSITAFSNLSSRTVLNKSISFFWSVSLSKTSFSNSRLSSRIYKSPLLETRPYRTSCEDVVTASFLANGISHL